MIEATAPDRFASERSHWYNADGSACHEVPYADPKKGMRPTTLRDARKFRLYPSVTSIIGCAYRPGLEKWKQDQILLASLTLPAIKGESSDDYCRRVREDAEAQAKLAREEGTEVHANLKRAFAGSPFRQEYAQTIQATFDVLREHFPNTVWRPNVSFCERSLGFGGELDLHGIDDKGRYIVIDFKGAEFTLEDIGKKEFTYDEHIMQLAAYVMGIDRPADCWFGVGNLFFSRNVPGLVHLHVWKMDEIVRGWHMFKALLQFWQASRDYVPK